VEANDDAAQDAKAVSGQPSETTKFLSFSCQATVLASMIVNMTLFTRVSIRTCRMRFASSNSKPALAYKGRIPKPAPPPPGPGEVVTRDKEEETQQARKAIMDAIKEDKDKDYKKRYNSKFWRWTGIICGTPIALVLTPYLFRRGRLDLMDLENNQR